ncbi:hypothetical protein NDU88_005580 [Pleurodeles waltl]|uniref:Uncharacterized protein n=1 Tax=Pleurodeles waltl TaxID=8319 RepID=A0AAV7TCM9_PLEWA|nr:hypothetical protein NDU88_005580 [Pleurodeles waltl]
MHCRLMRMYSHVVHRHIGQSKFVIGRPWQPDTPCVTSSALGTLWHVEICMQDLPELTWTLEETAAFQQGTSI